MLRRHYIHARWKPFADALLWVTLTLRGNYSYWKINSIMPVDLQGLFITLKEDMDELQALRAVYQFYQSSRVFAKPFEFIGLPPF